MSSRTPRLKQDDGQKEFKKHDERPGQQFFRGDQEKENGKQEMTIEQTKTRTMTKKLNTQSEGK
jgi:hypothetical protein